MRWLAMMTVAGVAVAGSAVAQWTPPFPYDGSGSWTRAVPEDTPPTDYKPKALGPFVAPGANAGATAMRDYAIVLEQGRRGFAADFNAAYDWYEKAAGKGDTYSLQKMCVAYLLGEGRPVDPAKSSSYCARLKNDDPVKLFGAAYDFEHGLSGPKDPGSALALYQQAAKAGSGEAMDAIAGQVLAQHPEKVAVARTWYKHAAMAGSADGLDHLAMMAEAGQGGPADADEAYWLYVNAARRGNAHARAWVTAHADHPPLPRVSVFKGAMAAPQPMLSIAASDAPGAATTPWQFAGDIYTEQMGHDEVESHARLDCYVGGDQHVDICLIMEEDPPSYGFGGRLQALFNHQVIVAAKGSDGQPTAHAVFVLAWDYALQRGP